jgi:1-acyl-sn-glycerol-3-phosphate acyltransferase
LTERAIDLRQRERSIVINTIRVILWLFFKIFYAIRWRHAERVPMAGPVILAPTHVSFYDPPMVTTPVRRKLTFFTRHVYFKGLLGPLIRYLGAFPVDLSKRFDRNAYDIAKRVLDGGGLLVLFPEGTRSHDGLLGEVQPGVAMLAVETGATIVPISIRGAFEAWPRMRKFPRFCRKIVITYHKPIAVEKIADKCERQQAIREINARIERVLAPPMRDWQKLLERRAQ